MISVLLFRPRSVGRCESSFFSSRRNFIVTMKKIRSWNVTSIIGVMFMSTVVSGVFFFFWAMAYFLVFPNCSTSEDSSVAFSAVASSIL